MKEVVMHSNSIGQLWFVAVKLDCDAKFSCNCEIVGEIGERTKL